MIKYENFAFERDKYQWILHHTTPSTDRNGNPSTKCHTTYHASLSQVFEVIMDRSAGECADLDELSQLLNKAHELIPALDRNVRNLDETDA